MTTTDSNYESLNDHPTIIFLSWNLEKSTVKQFLCWWADQEKWPFALFLIFVKLFSSTRLSWNKGGGGTTMRRKVIAIVFFGTFLSGLWRLPISNDFQGCWKHHKKWMENDSRKINDICPKKYFDQFSVWIGFKLNPLKNNALSLGFFASVFKAFLVWGATHEDSLEEEQKVTQDIERQSPCWALNTQNTFKRGGGGL